MNYSYTKQTELTFENTVEKVKETLAEEGFGVLTTVDVQTTLKKKIGINIGRYLILGACNPAIAHQALQMEYEIGLLLPCNIIIYEKGAQVFVSVIIPTVALGIVEKEGLLEIAQKAEVKLKQAINNIK
jgi:uncharacterized protein (DUF302 family)